MADVSTYTIGEIAERSGFSASALRYYEGIGLVEPTTRTAAGYRLYDDTTHLPAWRSSPGPSNSAARWRRSPISSAIWDGERCGPVQSRFHDLVTTKLADAERQIAELTALADQLRHAAARLAGPASDGPCDETCACVTLVTMTGKADR